MIRKKKKNTIIIHKQTSQENIIEESLNNDNLIINIDDKNYKTFNEAELQNHDSINDTHSIV